MVGIDEVGRGCLAGPLLVVATRAKAGLPEGLDDSKVLSRPKRERLFEELLEVCSFGEGWVKASEINRLGLAGAMRLGVRRALLQLAADYNEQIVMDGPVNYCPKVYKQVQCVIDADAIYPLVSAASVYAKVKRDEFMCRLALKHQRYGFDTNVGYGTRQHIEALNRYGYLKTVHRRFFAPVLAVDQTSLW